MPVRCRTHGGREHLYGGRDWTGLDGTGRDWTGRDGTERPISGGDMPWWLDRPQHLAMTTGRGKHERRARRAKRAWLPIQMPPPSLATPPSMWGGQTGSRDARGHRWLLRRGRAGLQWPWESESLGAWCGGQPRARDGSTGTQDGGGQGDGRGMVVGEGMAGQQQGDDDDMQPAMAGGRRSA
jgi:hypothetical protein